MNIRKATLNDAKSVSEIFSLCKEGMKKSGIDQWQTGTPNEETFLNDLENNVAYVGEDENEVVAYTAMVFGKDSTYEVIENGKWLTDSDNYCVLHRVAVHPKYRGKGAASLFMNFAENACKKNGIKSARIDTHKDNHVMQHTILKNGYEYCGIITIDDGTKRLAYEKIIND